MMGCPVCGHGLKTISASAECPYCEVLWHYHETDGFSYFEAEVYESDWDGEWDGDDWQRFSENWAEDFIEGGCVSDARAVLLWELVKFPLSYGASNYDVANVWWEGLEPEQREDLLDMMETDPALSEIIEDWIVEDVPDGPIYDDYDAEELKARSPTLTVTKVEPSKTTPTMNDITFENGLVAGYPKTKNAKVGDRFVVATFDGMFPKIMDAEDYGVEPVWMAESFRDWADDELRTHGENVSFENWAKEEFEDEPAHRHPNGQLSFVRWARDEMNEEHHNAEEFCAECGCSHKDAETLYAETSSGTQVFNSCWK